VIDFEVDGYLILKPFVMLKQISTSIAFFSLVLLIISCEKQETPIPPPAAKFSATTGNYFVVNSSSSSFKIPVSVTAATNVDRVINYTVTSPSGATPGTHYAALPGTIVIPAGKVIDSIEVKGLFSGYPTSTRKDTLDIKITGGDIPVAAYNTSYRLIMQKFCDVVPANLTGDYTRSTDTYNGAASTNPNYTANISAWTPVNATSATVIIKNMGATSDNGWGPFASTDPALNPGIKATLDWSNPANLTVNIASQNYFNDGTGMSTVTGSGTFSSCDQTFTITFTVKYALNGSNYTSVARLRR
jgi:hypothetical protein